MKKTLCKTSFLKSNGKSIKKDEKTDHSYNKNARQNLKHEINVYFKYLVTEHSPPVSNEFYKQHMPNRHLDFTFFLVLPNLH